MNQDYPTYHSVGEQIYSRYEIQVEQHEKFSNQDAILEEELISLVDNYFSTPKISEEVKKPFKKQISKARKRQNQINISKGHEKMSSNTLRQTIFDIVEEYIKLYFPLKVMGLVNEKLMSNQKLIDLVDIKFFLEGTKQTYKLQEYLQIKFYSCKKEKNNMLIFLDLLYQLLTNRQLLIEQKEDEQSQNQQDKNKITQSNINIQTQQQINEIIMNSLNFI